MQNIRARDTLVNKRDVMVCVYLFLNLFSVWPVSFPGGTSCNLTDQKVSAVDMSHITDCFNLTEHVHILERESILDFKIQQPDKQHL